jgi:NADPH-dependent ferric siderophore reductase
MRARPAQGIELLEADWHLFVGDEAALPAIVALTEALGPPCSPASASCRLPLTTVVVAVAHPKE